MDKFQFVLQQDQYCGVISRQDKHSSVIRRNPEDMKDDIENDTSATVSGFCECGWPYHMLFPCGSTEGEPYKICVFISDNTIDQQGIRTHCGSLSYCGARDRKYPDKRQMGYPFATPILINGKRSSVHEAASKLENMAIGDFKIIKTDTRFGPVNPTPTPPPTPEVKVYDKVAWYAQDQLDISKQSPYFPSQWIGVFRVLINGSDIITTGDSIVVQFEGRGKGNGFYTIKNATIGKRQPRSLAIIGQPIAIRFPGPGKGQTVVIPEEGTKSLPTEITFEEDNDYFITFQVLQPSCYLRNPGRSGQALYSTSGGDKLAKLADWRGGYEQVVINIYGVSKIFVPEN